MSEEEIVVCHCGRAEGDGLMVQCDLCLTWQHGLCLLIFTEDQVPIHPSDGDLPHLWIQGYGSCESEFEKGRISLRIRILQHIWIRLYKNFIWVGTSLWFLFYLKKFKNFYKIWLYSNFSIFYTCLWYNVPTVNLALNNARVWFGFGGKFLIRIRQKRWSSGSASLSGSYIKIVKTNVFLLFNVR